MMTADDYHPRYLPWMVEWVATRFAGDQSGTAALRASRRVSRFHGRSRDWRPNEGMHLAGFARR